MGGGKPLFHPFLRVALMAINEEEEDRKKREGRSLKWMGGRERREERRRRGHGYKAEEEEEEEEGREGCSSSLPVNTGKREREREREEEEKKKFLCSGRHMHSVSGGHPPHPPHPPKSQASLPRPFMNDSPPLFSSSSSPSFPPSLLSAQEGKGEEKLDIKDIICEGGGEGGRGGGG